MFHCNEKFNVQIQPYLNKIKHVFLFLCSVVTGLPTTTKAPPPSQKWVEGNRLEGGLSLSFGFWFSCSRMCLKNKILR